MSVLDTLRAVIRFQRFEADPVARRLSRAADVEDLRRLARRRLPGGVFDYIDGGAEDERTLAANEAEFARWGFRPRVLRDVSEIDTSTELLGSRLPLPLVMAPTGFPRIAHSQGELAVARAAARAGVPFTLSTLGTRSIEEVRGVSDGDLWFQVYVWKDRDLQTEMLRRAAVAGYSTIMITVDTAVLGRRERDVRRGFSLPPTIGPATLVDGALHPGWTLDFLRAEPIRFANVTGREGADGASPVSLSAYINEQFDPRLSWDELRWFRERWPGKVLLKGVQTVDDARIAADHGVDGIVLSNHGGRQLDGAPPALSLVPAVSEAVGGRVAVLCDGGVRRGSDIVRAVALGADAVMIGRPHFYALGAGGEQGVDHLLGLLRTGLERTMALCGVASIADLGPELLERRDP